MRAAILEEWGKPLVVGEVELGSPGLGEVRVKIAATGVCHSDLSVQKGLLPWPVPAVLGHEAAGEVVEVGSGVRSVAVGDHVVISWVPMCGTCFFCTRDQAHLCITYRYLLGKMDDGTSRISKDGVEISHGVNSATFAEEAIVRETAVVKIPKDVPLDVAALIGCAVLTGVFAAITTARIVPGERVAVIGCGGVGLNVIQGCRIAGASTILAIDPVESKRDAAVKFGATHTCAPDDAAGMIMGLTDNIGPDAVFEVVGRAALQRTAFDLVRAGGRAVMVGAAPLADEPSFPSLGFLFMEKKILGCYYGSCNPRRDIPRIIDLWRAGSLDLEGLVTDRMPLESVNEAFEAMEAGTAIRTLLVP
ncbi:MAG: Zn-dependent alcohol dehydrogenase [Actinomycetota bacterium]